MESNFPIDEQPVPEIPESSDVIQVVTGMYLQSSRLEDALAAEKKHAQKETARLLCDMLEVLDALERIIQRFNAVEGLSGMEEKWKGHIEATQRLFLQKLKKYGVFPVEMMGTQVDPHLAEVEDTELRPELPEETVIEEYVRAYTWNGELLRQARVIVSKQS